MSISAMLYTGQRALATHLASLQVAGQNVSNVNTPGYSRQRAELAPHEIANQGQLLSGGVDVGQITRAYDQFVTAQLNDANSQLQHAQVQSELLGEVEALFNELSADDTGLGQALDDLFNAFQDLANDPGNQAVRTVLLRRAETVTTTFQHYDANLQQLNQRLGQSLEDELTQVNLLTKQISALNAHISQVEAVPPNAANALRDERDQLVQQLAEKVAITAFEVDNGQVTVLLKGGRPLVEGERANHLIAQVNPDEPTQRIVYMQDAANHLTKVTSQLTSGRVSGLLDVMDGVIPQLTTNLDRLAAQLTGAFNQMHQTGFGLDGSTGHHFFEPRQVSGVALQGNAGGGELQHVGVVDPTVLPLDRFDITFVSNAPPSFDIVNAATGNVVVGGGSYTSGASIFFEGIEVVISDSGTPPQSGDTFVIDASKGAARHMAVNPALLNNVARIAAGQTAQPGDNSNALALGQLREASLLDGQTAGTFYATFLADIGAASQQSIHFAQQHQSHVAEIENRRESISGVSIDEEQVDLIRFQQAYQAAARLISISDELSETVLEMAR